MTKQVSSKQVANIKRGKKHPVTFSLTDYFYMDKWPFEILLHTLLDSTVSKAVQG